MNPFGQIEDLIVGPRNIAELLPGETCQAIRLAIATGQKIRQVSRIEVGRGDFAQGFRIEQLVLVFDLGFISQGDLFARTDLESIEPISLRNSRYVFEAISGVTSRLS